MTDKNNKSIIINTILNQTKLDAVKLDKLLEKYNIDLSYPKTITDAINKIYKEKNNIEIPKFKKITTLSKPSFVTGARREIIKKVYPKESKPLRKKIRIYNTDLSRLNEILPIIKCNEQKKNLIKPGIQNTGEGKLVDEILEVVLGGELKKYSLRKIQTELNNNGYKIDHSTLGNKFKKENFKLLISAGIMRKEDLTKKPDDLKKLGSFNNWFKDIYFNESKKYKNINSCNNETTEYYSDRKSGRAGIHPGQIQDELIDKMNFNQ